MNVFSSRLTWLLPVLLAVAGCTVHAAQERDSEPARYLRMWTAAGDLYFELHERQAPLTTRNFLRYVDEDAFDGGSFYRTVRDDNQPDNKVLIDVIQGGPQEGFTEHDPIALERTRDTGLGHRAGCLSMARAAPGTATAHFFICIEDEPELDFGGARNPDGQGFAVFGQLVSGMDVAKAIHSAPAQAQALQPPIAIHSIREVAPIEVLAAQLAARPHEPDFIGGLMPGDSRERVISVLGLPARREALAGRRAIEALGLAAGDSDLVYAIRTGAGDLQPVWLQIENGALLQIKMPQAE
ncbi:MAG: peptidylprolyl isomerase [Gammaproteobacteria bacterium]|nr:peptidylprolyl isomerase [Gammaproteobacteria bacterium]